MRPQSCFFAIYLYHHTTTSTNTISITLSTDSSTTNPLRIYFLYPNLQTTLTKMLGPEGGGRGRGGYDTTGTKPKK